MSKSKFTLDATKFLKDFSQYAKFKYPEIVRQSMYKTGWFIIQLALKKKPYVPREIGDLQSSGDVVVETKGLELWVGFNKAYAAAMHEGKESWNWTLPGSGPKYLESKLSMFKDDIIEFMADLVNKAVGRL